MRVGPVSPFRCRSTSRSGASSALRSWPQEPVPPFVNSSRDGYALRSADTAAAARALPARLRVVGSIMAGTVFEGTVGPGEAVRIMTGAPLPAGADAVCMLEDSTDEDDGSVVADRPARGRR